MNYQIRSKTFPSPPLRLLVGRSCCVFAHVCVAFRPPFAAVVAVLIGIILCFSRHSYAGAFDYNDPGWQGTTQLLALARTKLGSSRVRLTANIDYAKLTPRDGLIVLHPTVVLRSESLSEFMARGGRVAVIDDYGRGGTFFDEYEIRRFNAPIQPSATLRGNVNLAWAFPSSVAGAESAGAVHPMVDGLQRVLTNHAVVLSNSRLTPVLEITSPGGERYALAYAGVIGHRGRMFAMGDPSVLINLMLRYPENRQFAERLVTYLVAKDEWGAREGELYLVSNEFSQTDSAQGDWLSKRAAENLAHRTRELIRGPLPEPVAWAMAVLLALYMGRWAWTRMIQSLHPSIPRFALPMPLLGKPGESARAAVLAAATTPRALALLELNSGMHSYISAELELDGNLDTRALFEALTKAGAFDEREQHEFKWYMETVKRVQASLAAGRRTRVGVTDLRRAHRLMVDIAERINQQRPS